MSTNPLNKDGLAKALDPSRKVITPRKIIQWAKSRKIPAIRIGYRTVLFDETAVRKALNQFEVKPLG